MKPYTCLVTLFLAAQTVWALNPHPRIWLTPTLISTITTKMNANDAAWVTLKANADTLKTYSVAAYDRNVCAANTICYSYEGSGWYEAMIRLALVYKITGDVSYAAKAKTLLIAMNAPYKNSGDLTPIQLDSGYPTRFVMPALAIGYDWLYDYLDSGTKTDTINTVNAAYTWISTGASPAAYCMAGSPCSGPPYMNYFGGHMLGLGAAADATDGDNATSTAMYNWVNSQLSTALGYGLQAGPSTLIPYQGYYLATGGFNGGAVPESYSYGTSHAQRLWQLLLLWKTSGRSDLTGTYSGWLKTSVKNLIYTLRPNLWQVGDEGDYAGNCSGALHADYPLFLAYILNGTTEGAWSEYLYRNLATNPCSTNPGDGLVLNDYSSVLWKDSTRTSTNYAPSLSLNYFNDGDAHLLSRSDWTSAAVFLSFNGSGAHFTDHQNKAGGNLEVQRGSDYLLVDAAQWKTLVGYGPGQPSIFNATSNYASTLYFDDGGAYMYTGASYNGGQGIWGTTNLLAHSETANVSYALADLTAAYDKRTDSIVPANRTARYYYRAVGHMGTTIFVWDRFKSKNAAYTKRLQWHLNPANAPTVAGSVISTVKGSSKLFIDTLLPSSPTITTARDLADSDGATPLTYNIQVSDSVSGTDLNALTILYATASGGGLPSTALITTDANWVGAQIADSIPLVAVFAKTVKDNGNNTYTPLTYTSTTFTTTHSGTGRYLVAGLQLGTYAVFRDGAAIPGYTSVAVGVDGTLFFNAAAGVFSILQSTSTISPCDLNGDGVVNALDVQNAINQALGPSACGSADLDGNGICNVVDVQRMIAAATGQACRVGQ